MSEAYLLIDIYLTSSSRHSSLTILLAINFGYSKAIKFGSSQASGKFRTCFEHFSWREIEGILWVPVLIFPTSQWEMKALSVKVYTKSIAHLEWSWLHQLTCKTVYEWIWCWPRSLNTLPTYLCCWELEYAGYALRAPFAGPVTDHWLVEALKTAFALRTHLGDPGACTTTSDCYLDLTPILNATLSSEFAGSLR